MTRALGAGLLMTALATAGVAAADQWPRFRGDQAGVAADDPALPDQWSQTENVRWKVALPGLAWSSPIVWDDHIFVTSVVNSAETEAPKPGLYFGGERPTPTVEHRWVVYDIDFVSGKVRWQQEVRRGVPSGPRHLKNSYGSETPVTDGERVYALFGGVGLFAFDMKGQTAWVREMEPAATRFGWGTAQSPVLHGDRLYLLNDNDTRSYLAALDKRTGKEIWRVDWPAETNWATPFVWEHDKGVEIVTSATDAVRSYDTSGKLKWELKGMSSIAIPTPFAKHGLLYISSGYVGDAVRPVYAIRPGAAGDISLKKGEIANAFVAWSDPQLGTYNTSAVVYGDIFYTLLDRGFLLAHDARTGREIYTRQRIAPDASGFTASPWAYNDRVFAMSEDGDTYVIQAGPQFRVLAKNSLGEMAMASPAIARGSLILRTSAALYRIARPGTK